MMTDLPPLNAMRAFEVAARTGSFVQAGVELGVTAAAISLQVKALEAHLGKKLFLRQGNRIIMTDAGRSFQPGLEAAFAGLKGAVADLGDGQGRARLVVSVLPSLVDRWLIPALARYEHCAGLELRAEEDPVAFARDGVDLRLTYGAHYYPDHRVLPLFSDHIVPVAAPAFGAGHSAADLAGLPDGAFIHTDWGPAFGSQPSWRVWFATGGQRRAPDPAQGLRVGQTGLAVAAALAGMGVALVPWRFVTADLASGRLIQPDPASLPMAWDYVLIHPGAPRRHRGLRDLIAFLVGCGQTDPRGGGLVARL